MAAPRRPFLLAALIVVMAVTALGTILWIVMLMRPVPQGTPAPIAGRRIEHGVLVLTLAPSASDPFDQIGATVRAFGLALASGQVPAADHVAAIAFEAPRPALRLVYDRGVLVSGIISGQSEDHLLGLAGAGGRWPDAAAARGYCERMETARGAFCKHSGGRS